MNLKFAFNAKGDDAPPEVYNRKLFYVILTAAFGSVIFGYDLAFIGGVFALPSFINRFGLANIDATATRAHMVNTFQGGAFVGVIAIFFVCERFGRRISLLASGTLFNAGVVFQMACGGNIPLFYVGRFVTGLGIGGTSFVIPQFLSECAPPASRGGIIGTFEIGMQVGLIIGFWINYGVERTVDPVGDTQWFIPISFQFIPAVLMMVGVLFLCESPRWLYVHGRIDDAVKALVWLRQLPVEHPVIVNELADYERQTESEISPLSSSGLRSVVSEAFSANIWPRIVIGCALMIFQNSTGINAMNNFSVVFFRGLGFSANSLQLLSTGIYGIVKGVAATITFLFLVDRFGRRLLFLIGSAICAFSMYYVAASSLTNSFESTQAPNALGYSAAAFIYIFGAGYAVGWNLPWIVAAEIYPTKVRSFCVMLTTCSHWVGQFYTSYAVGYMLRDITYGTFLFFGTMTVLGAVYVWFFLPETQGVILEDMDALFAGKGSACSKMKQFKEYKENQQILNSGERSKIEEDGKGEQSSLA